MREYAIRDYAIIGNCETCALVSPDGGIDWLCLPFFDSPSFFGALLDPEKGGSFFIRPSVPYRVERSYEGDSAVLVTRFITADSCLELRDFFVIARDAWSLPFNLTDLATTRKLVRRIKVTGPNPVPVEWRLDARPNYARSDVQWRRSPVNPALLTCDETGFYTDLPCERHGRTLSGQTVAEPGRPYCAVLDYAPERRLPDEPTVARYERLTSAYWEAWNSLNRYIGPRQKEVRRSAVTLKLLTYPRTGGFVAAPTTSLPERIGGDQNWDYRYVWLRDSAFFINTFMRLGYTSEAKGFFNFLIKRAVDARRMGRDGKDEPLLDVLYPIHSGAKTEEEFLGHLSGYRNSAPVRTGNRAARQLQIDNCAHILESLDWYRAAGGRLTREMRELAGQMASDVCAHWNKPDNGIWEVLEKRRYTYGRIMSWTALETAARLLPERAVALRFIARQVREETLAQGVRTRNGVPYLSASFEEGTTDASGLIAFLNGFCGADLGRSTREAVEQELLEGQHVYRNPEKRDIEREGAFVICGFWRVRHLIKEGETARAEAALDELIACASPLGLLAEEIVPSDGTFLGNFPQAFSHLGLIDSVLDLECAKLGEPRVLRPRLSGIRNLKAFLSTRAVWDRGFLRL
jgi:GH15 family glucan-1,4-alpha-glucosidase